MPRKAKTDKATKVTKSNPRMDKLHEIMKNINKDDDDDKGSVEDDDDEVVEPPKEAPKPAPIRKIVNKPKAKAT
jgi:hypothetical protein